MMSHADAPSVIFSGELCRRAGVTFAQLRSALASRKLALPPRDSTGRFVWPVSAIEDLRKAVAVDLRRKVQLAASSTT
jgi:hypothetical protein